MRRRLLAAVIALAVAGCSWSFGGGRKRCAHPVALTATDFTLGAGTGGTGLGAAYPCITDAGDQSDRLRALHCGIAAAGVALGAVFVASALTGLDHVRHCD